jgi:hypothetical protein
MDEPLTNSQQSLRGCKIADMAIYQLHDWIAACKTMELWAKDAKARDKWHKSGQEAAAELQRRLST